MGFINIAPEVRPGKAQSCRGCGRLQLVYLNGAVFDLTDNGGDHEPPRQVVILDSACELCSPHCFRRMVGLCQTGN